MHDLSVLFLCRRYYYLHKMSRVRFRAVHAIGKACRLTWSGPGWENWDDALPAAENIARIYEGEKPPDLVLCYKSSEIPGLADIPYPSAVNRDELQTLKNPVESTVQALTENRIDLVISHQKKQIEHPLFRELPCHFAYIPYCVDTSLFKDYEEKKEVDVLLIGCLAPRSYPLRAKLHKYVIKMLSDARFRDYKITIHSHPGYRLKNAWKEDHVVDYARLINSSKICLTCSGVDHLKFAKYIEVPACRSLLVADMPAEDQDILKKYIVEIPSDVSYEEFTQKLLYYLEHSEEREKLTETGYKIVKENFTLERYASDFIAIVKEYLAKYGHKKLWKKNSGK